MDCNKHLYRHIYIYQIELPISINQPPRINYIPVLFGRFWKKKYKWFKSPSGIIKQQKSTNKYEFHTIKYPHQISPSISPWNPIECHQTIIFIHCSLSQLSQCQGSQRKQNSELWVVGHRTDGTGDGTHAMFFYLFIFASQWERKTYDISNI